MRRILRAGEKIRALVWGEGGGTNEHVRRNRSGGKGEHRYPPAGIFKLQETKEEKEIMKEALEE